MFSLLRSSAFLRVSRHFIQIVFLFLFVLVVHRMTELANPTPEAWRNSKMSKSFEADFVPTRIR